MTILAGMTRVRFTVTITDDDVQENDETFRLSIRNNLSDDFTFSNRVAIVNYNKMMILMVCQVFNFIMHCIFNL